MDKIIVKIEKSGNRYNAFDKDGNKFTSDITTGGRKKAFMNGNALERRVNKSGSSLLVGGSNVRVRITFGSSH